MTTTYKPAGDTPTAQVANAIRAHLCTRPDHDMLGLAAQVIHDLQYQPSTPHRDQQLVHAIAVVTTHPHLSPAEQLQALGMEHIQ